VQVTTVQADAADEVAIEAVCKRALDEEGRLDVFFANVCELLFPSLHQAYILFKAGVATLKLFPDISAADFTENMRINALS
jgi:NAD(P)-dependent dehydrogenase (short-subunit alcohol dehydrogenase family)